MKRSRIALWGLAVLVIIAVVVVINQSTSPATQPSATSRPLTNRSTVTPSEFSPEVLDAIEEQVRQLRGLDALHPVTHTLQTRDELEQSMIELQEQSYSREEARNDVLSLAAFDLVEPDLNLYDTYTALLTEQVLGFYDPDAKSLYVVSDAETFGPLEKIAYAHEYDHALQDQNFDLVALGFSNQSEQSLDGDVQLARQALIEGDATYLMQLWLSNHLSQDEMLTFLSQSREVDTSVLDSLPPIFSEALLFPYQTGLNFIVALYNAGGWEAVNAAFRNPPQSSEQIMHPDKYPDDQPIPVSLPPLTGTLGANWRLADEDVLGEWYLRQVLNAHLSSHVLAATEGWGGDRYAVYVTRETFDDPSREPEYVLVMSHVWDSAQDAGEFASAYRTYIETRFDLSGPTRSDGAAGWWVGSQTTYFLENGDRTVAIIGPDEATVQRIVDAIQP
jgi:hypothetical protein